MNKMDKEIKLYIDWVFNIAFTFGLVFGIAFALMMILVWS